MPFSFPYFFWTARERRLWRMKRPQQLGSHLRLRKQSAAQMLSGNPDQAKEIGTPEGAGTVLKNQLP